VNPGALSWYEHQPDGWQPRGIISIQRMLYIMNGKDHGQHHRKVIRVTPAYDLERFSLTYECWKTENGGQARIFNPAEAFHNNHCVSRGEIVAEWQAAHGQ